MVTMWMGCVRVQWCGRVMKVVVVWLSVAKTLIKLLVEQEAFILASVSTESSHSLGSRHYSGSTIEEGREGLLVAAQNKSSELVRYMAFVLCMDVASSDSSSSSAVCL